MRARPAVMLVAILLLLPSAAAVVPGPGAPDDPDLGTRDDPVPEARDLARRTWNRATATLAEALAPVVRIVDPLVSPVLGEAGADRCRLVWRDVGVGPGSEGWNGVPVWCPSGEDAGRAPADTSSLRPPTPLPPGSDRSVPARAEETAPDPRRPDAAYGTARQAPRTPGPAPGLLGLVLVATLLAILVAPRLYHRLSRDQLLDNPNRREIVEILRRRPGRTCADLARRVGVDYNTARYHLDILMDYDLAVERRFGQQRRYYLRDGGHDATDKRLAAALDVRTKRRILETLRERGAVASGELAEVAEVAPSTCSEHLRDLVDAGLLERARSGRKVLYDLGEDVPDALGRVA